MDCCCSFCTQRLQNAHVQSCISPIDVLLHYHVFKLEVHCAFMCKTKELGSSTVFLLKIQYGMTVNVLSMQ